MPVIVFSVVSLLTCLIPQHSLVLMFSFSFKESQERRARKVDVFDFGKWVDASCKGNKIYHRGLLRGGERKYCSFVTKDCLEDCFGLISLKPMSHCFHYKDFYVPVSFGKDLIYFEINPRLPKCTVCFQAQHMRAVHRGHIAQELGERVLFRSWDRIAKESVCDQPHGSRGATVLGWYCVCYFCKDFEREDIWAAQSYCILGPWLLPSPGHWAQCA